MAAEEGVNVVDCAFAPLAGVTSQPSLNALVEATRFTDRDTGIDFESLQETANYWEDVRKYYAPFETGQLASSAEVYLHEMPGGQYANLYQQAHSLGVAERWHEVGRMYAGVNKLFGDIVKVTPTSKVVGDMTLFMLANNLTPEQVLTRSGKSRSPNRSLSFSKANSASLRAGFRRHSRRILRGRKPLTDRPGVLLEPADFAKVHEALTAKLSRTPSDQEVISHLLYPKVFDDFADYQAKYSDLSVLPTPVFFHGMQKGEEVSIDIEPGKTLIVKFLTVGDPQPDGRRVVYFELNGQPREVLTIDKSLDASAVEKREKAELGNAKHVAAPMPGSVVGVAVAVGEEVAVGQKLLTLEAMKMESTLYAELAGKVAEVLVRPGTQVEGGDLVIRFDEIRMQVQMP